MPGAGGDVQAARGRGGCQRGGKAHRCAVQPSGRDHCGDGSVPRLARGSVLGAVPSAGRPGARTRDSTELLPWPLASSRSVTSEQVPAVEDVRGAPQKLRFHHSRFNSPLIFWG